MDVGGNGGIGQRQNLRRAAVVRFDSVNPGFRIAFGELEDILEIRAAPRVDALRIVAHHHDIVVSRGQKIDELALEFVRVLIFIHEDELETALI